jgi:GTP-binding protein Era
MSSPSVPTRCGTVALIGLPNAGKSTLLNGLLGQKLSIVSNKPQTTRNRVVGVVTRAPVQAVLLDTPGIHDARTRLNEAMVEIAREALQEADTACWVVDAKRLSERVEQRRDTWHIGMQSIAALVPQNVTVALNKVDIVHKPLLLPIIALFQEKLPFATCVPVSAESGDGLDRLFDAWAPKLPPGPFLFDADAVTDQPERFFVAELIREKVFRHTHEELPYAAAVEIEKYTEPGPDAPSGAQVEIFARIIVERPGQKAIVVGRGGEMIKKIGTEARKDINALLGARVHLELHVSVEPDWTRDPRRIAQLQSS